MASFPPASPAILNHSSPPGSPKASLRGRALVLSSSQDLLTAFLFFHFRVPAAQITWTMGQQAFNSCMILLLDAMETGELSRIDKVEKAYVVFQQLEKNGVHNLASMAVERVSWGLAELRRMTSAPDTHVRTRAPLVTREGGSRCDAEMQGTAKNEARPGFGSMHDTVMGNTGMLLLEDPGLQSFVPEAFTPLTWSMGPGFLTGTEALTKQTREEEHQKRDERVQLEDAKPPMRYEDVRDARSSEQWQDATGSPGSAPRRFGTFSTAPSQESQPQGLTAPTSSPSPTSVLQEQHRHQHSLGSTPTGFDQPPSPHWRHHSYPELHQSPLPPPITPNAHATTHRRESQGSNAIRYEHRGQFQTAGAGFDQEEEPDGGSLQALMPQFASPRPSLRTLHEVATTSAPGHFAAFSNPNVHPSWAARPVAPSTSFSEPALSFSRMSPGGQATPAFSQQSAPGSTWQHRIPIQLSSTSDAPVSAPAGTQAEYYAMDAWRWASSGGFES